MAKIKAQIPEGSLQSRFDAGKLVCMRALAEGWY
jgi:hypothetical protein